MMDDIINQCLIPMSSSTDAPVRRIQRVRHDIVRRELDVARVESLGPHFAAITLQGESLSTFRSDSFDDHVKVFLGDIDGDGARRDYTPRHFDRERRELTLEFALHGTGPAADWARQAAVGQRLVIAGPRGSMVIPTDYAWHLLIGDASALPAVHRRLEELPAEARAIVLLQVDDAQDQRPLASAAALDLHWVESTGALLSAVTALALPEGDGFAWAAGEAATMARVRSLLLDKGLPKESLKVAAYWKAGAAAFHETLDA
jgi:NADPH-dependent ferric siderophore reductase